VWLVILVPPVVVDQDASIIIAQVAMFVCQESLTIGVGNIGQTLILMQKAV
jgi:hypothetical protein